MKAINWQVLKSCHCGLFELEWPWWRSYLPDAIYLRNPATNVEEGLWEARIIKVCLLLPHGLSMLRTRSKRRVRH
ncbi:conserved hypothetical protein [Histoplasma capsulatum var. duboisii H88]|uniref:Uncharacterized protein n=1 Tax=Ajellomyces capsulatus (strain H88) TaxID=544711 RepID=F0UAE9_AJEC8|nr:conserved hypothetical protein [Histoplasma capsulatum var. duboisii H88]